MTAEYSDLDYAKDFIVFLSRFKKTDEVDMVTLPEKNCITSPDYYQFLAFKTTICEMIFRAINNMPHIIKEYTIVCTNNKGKATIKIGISDELDGEGEISVLRVITPKKTYCLSKTDVNTIYIANRTNFYNEMMVHKFISILYGGPDGYEPLIKTSWVSTRCETKYKM